jgi:type I restriction enzyme S subunit
VRGTPSDLPDGWELQTVEELAEPKGIAYGVLKPGPQSPSGVPMLRVSDVRNSRIDASDLYMISPQLDAEYRRTKLRGGEVVVSIQGSVGRVAVVPPELAGANVSRTLAMIRPKDPALAPWIHRALEAPFAQAAMREVIGGTTRDSLNLRDLRRIELPIPPEPIRSQILKVVELSTSKVTTSSGHLTAARRTIDRFRQAVLTAASSGRLTSDWRSVRGIIDDEELPGGWIPCVLDDLGEWRTGGTPSRKHPEFYGGEVPWVKSGDLRDGPVTSTEEHITPAGLENSSAKVMPVGTVSVALYGATIGRLGVLEIDAATNQACANCVPDSSTVDNWFLFYFLYGQRQQLIAAGQGGAQPNLTNRIVRDWPIALPPIDEQREIVRRASALLETADALISRLDSARLRVDRTSQSVLAKAFRGGLGD